MEARLPPEDFKKLVLFADVMPLARQSGVWPLTGYVLNIHFRTDPHYDPMDALGICAVGLLTKCNGGGLVLHEARVVVDLEPLDFMFFKSSHQTHFNEHYEGRRASIVLSSDAQAARWARDFDKWGHHAQ
jgi:hypothetical protein